MLTPKFQMRGGGEIKNKKIHFYFFFKKNLQIIFFKSLDDKNKLK